MQHDSEYPPSSGGLRERFLTLTIPEPNTGCWLWLGATNGTNREYPCFQRSGRTVAAHRLAYELFKEPIPAGLTLDHLCRQRLCVNPDHLEPVSNRENIMRGQGAPALNARRTHCAHGHEFTPENTYHRPNGWRQCRECARTWDRDKRKK